MQHLVIRADSNSRIGTGHIMRCIALAQAWKKRGGEVTFISYAETPWLHQHILKEGFNLVPIQFYYPDPFDLEVTLDFLFNLRTSNQDQPLLVADGYHFNSDYQNAIKEKGYKLLVIDDYNHLPFYQADILLNQNINAQELRYSCSENTLLLLGCEYAMLRREFLQYKGLKRKIPDKARNILVTMGGADFNNVTLKILKAIYLLNDPDIESKVIIGPANPHRNVLEAWIKDHEIPVSLIVSPPPENIPQLMLWADFAITAGGSTCWELAFMGVPSLIITVAKNQEGIGYGLEKAGVARNLGWFLGIRPEKLSLEIKGTNKNIREGMYKKSKKLVDGLGTKRILDEISRI